MNRRTAILVWLAVGAVALGVEAWALKDSRHHDTLSALIWRIKRTGLGRFLANAAGAWLTWHFGVQPHLPEHVEEGLRDTPADDFGVVAIALIASVPPREEDK